MKEIKFCENCKWHNAGKCTLSGQSLVSPIKNPRGVIGKAANLFRNQECGIEAKFFYPKEEEKAAEESVPAVNEEPEVKVDVEPETEKPEEEAEETNVKKDDGPSAKELREEIESLGGKYRKNDTKPELAAILEELKKGQEKRPRGRSKS